MNLNCSEKKMDKEMEKREIAQPAPFYTELLRQATETQALSRRLLQKALTLRVDAATMQLDYASLYGVLDPHLTREEETSKPSEYK